MATTSPSPLAERAPTVRPGLLVAQQAVALSLAVLVLIMAVLAGRSLFGTWDITVHGVVGNVVFTLAVVAAGLAFANRSSRPVRTAAVLFLVLTFAQVGLGYSGRTSIDAAAWHVPNGVLLMGVAAWQLQLVGPPRRSR